jgi:c-di-GMP-binding flagellar brake protein YcgR
MPRPEVLRMLAPRSVEVLQERRHVRIRAARRVVVYGRGVDDRVESFTVDVGAGGLLLTGSGTLVVGDEITFNLALTAGALPITGTARVVRVDALGRCAVSFGQISDPDRRRLVEFILECRRSEEQSGGERELAG